jgi:hypothetical protein
LHFNMTEMQLRQVIWLESSFGLLFIKTNKFTFVFVIINFVY